VEEISVTENAPGTYLVEVRGARTSTTHEVRVPRGLAEQIGGGGTTDPALVQAAFGFLLEHEPNTSILRTFSIDQIGDYFPGWSTDVAGRLADSGTAGSGASGAGDGPVEGVGALEEVERRVDEQLRTAGVSYNVVECAPDLADTAAFCEAYGYSPEDSANTIVVVGKSDPPLFVACVVLATTRLDVNHAVRDRLGVRKASFADREQTAALTGMAIGGVTPFGLPEAMPLWVDSRVIDRPRIVLGGGSRRRKIVAPPAILTALPGTIVIEALATAPSA
jgi:prolyl-tRNA editing enzyme YbaK/EbsC (Cys-tRNA(Pro) deacylase)